MNSVTFTLDFPVVPKGRPRKGKHGFYTPTRTKNCEVGIRFSAKQHFKERFTGPVSIVCVLASGRGDLDNRLKTILDALNGIAYEDDRQVQKIVVEQTDQALSTIITVTELP